MKVKSVGFRMVLVALLTILLCFAGGTIAWAAIPQQHIRCMGCHSNPGGGVLLTQYQGPGGCIECHSSPDSSTTYELDLGGGMGQTVTVPVVLYTGEDAPTTYLASGNFYWLAQGYDNNGHNVFHLNNPDDVLDGPPGPINQSMHDELIVNDSNLTCAGVNGCHGYRLYGDPLLSGLPAINGAHHGNVDGKCDAEFIDPDDIAYNVSNSYRFLLGVKGLENTIDRWENRHASSHNEYYGATTPPQLGCSISGVSCHGSSGVTSPNSAMSGFCGTCHGNFHTLGGGSDKPSGYVSDDIGIGSAEPPFFRHPSDIGLKNEGEYAVENRAYSAQAPVGRTYVPDSIIDNATADDVLMCLSCHAAHGSPYPNMLRWDTGGCFNCHTNK